MSEFITNAELRIEAERLCDENDQLKAENAELREQLAKARDPQRIGGTADHESFVYAIEQLREFRWQHATNDEEAIPYINNIADAHERETAELQKTLQQRTEQFEGMCEMWVERGVENAKLRELLLDCWDFSHLMHEAMAARFYELGLIDDGEARELGVEVDG